MALTGKLLYHLVVAVFVRYEESPFDIAAVRVLPLLVEHFFVMLIVVMIDSAVEGEEDHLRGLQMNAKWVLSLFESVYLTSSGSSPPGIRVPSLEQKQ